MTSDLASPTLARWDQTVSRSINFRPAVAAALDAKGDHRAGAFWHLAFGQSMVGVTFQAGIGDPGDRLRLGQERGHRLGVGDMTVHTRPQCLDALKQMKGGGWAHAGAKVTRPLGAGAHGKCLRAKFLGEVETVIARVRLGQRRKFAARFPIEITAIDDHTANRHTMAAQPFGRRMHDQMGAEIKRPAKIGRDESGVDQQRQFGLASDRRQTGDISDLQAGVADGFTENQPCLRPNGAAKRIQITGIDLGRGDSEARQRMAEQIVTAAVEGVGGDDMAALAHQGGDGQEQSGMARSGGHRRHAAIEGGHPLLENRHGRIGDARVNMPGPLQIE